MATELAFALINPYTISKSRTGGVIGRLLTRTGLELVAARMFGPSQELAEKYAALLRGDPATEEEERQLLADYVQRCYAPDTKTGKPRRVLMLLFEGEDAIVKIAKATGKVRHSTEASDTVRGTYGDFIRDEHGQVRHVEPAVMVGWTHDSAGAALRLWADYSERDGGLVEAAVDVYTGADHYQRTLVLIKPDNFRFPSARPGNIIDIFSGSGLRIIGAKVHRMTVAEAEEFYGPVRQVLRAKLKGSVGQRAAAALAKELGFELPPDTVAQLGETLGPMYGDDQFYKIIQFMTGQWGPACTLEEKQKKGKERCLALVYAGLNAVEKIRGILGPTDPSKAQPGSVRKEFGQDIMVNAAHASDSPENAAREMKIIRVEDSMIREWVDRYYPAKGA
ncbi:MAG TPA: nucleoside-diphosphate kinase [Kiritimatiellia bacterium]|nr:nucleoside-diphosphate kinase [Kiritimatiellia bacterium]HRZ11158.1 nucleoside-diphosphate kinase [Kiritimatiellia bacterium]HSA19470.1 nucleoside-diphosphate kinase [Kiritimatiellia bacterium]